MNRFIPCFQLSCIVGVCVGSLLIGCTERVTMIPNADPSLNRSAERFAADAAACFPYPADAPRGAELQGRVNVGYTYNQLSLVNYSGGTWRDVRIWINREYVLPMESIEPNNLKRLNFKFFYDADGRHFPLDNKETRVERVELMIGDTLHPIRFEMAT
jgi:hypothetical protein